jgi:hypothetical protein
MVLYINITSQVLYINITSQVLYINTTSHEVQINDTFILKDESQWSSSHERLTGRKEDLGIGLVPYLIYIVTNGRACWGKTLTTINVTSIKRPQT